MRWVAALVLAGCVGGCAGGGSVPPVPPGESPPAPPAPTAQPVSEVPAAIVEPPEPAVDHTGNCAEVGELVGAGEHKPAVDAFDSLVGAGGSCEDAVLGAVGESRRVLGEADLLARRGLEARGAGDVASARASFAGALELYPKYYWVQRLIQDLPAAPEPAGDDILRRVTELRAGGRVEEALALLSETEGEGAADPRLEEEIESLRVEVGDQRLGAAYREQRAGNLKQAVELTLRAIEARPGEPVRAQLVDFARRLGLDLFSAGELVAAQSLWRAALELDAAHEQLQQYLAEVETRLRSLDDIKSGEDG